MPSSGFQTCALDRKSTRLNSSHTLISYAVFCLKKKNNAALHLGGHERRCLTFVTPVVCAPRRRCLVVVEPLAALLRDAAQLVLFFFFLKPRAPQDFPLSPPAPLF